MEESMTEELITAKTLEELKKYSSCRRPKDSQTPASQSARLNGWKDKPTRLDYWTWPKR